MNRLVLATAGLLILGIASCDPGRIPNRNVSDCSHTVEELTDTIDKVVVTNPNNTRVGTEWRVRVMRRGQQGIFREDVQFLYIAAMQDGFIDVDFSDVCGANTPPPEGSGEAEELPCEDLYAHAVMLQTYWLADE
jgi:hypothetical protein